ncbi:zinc finger protein 33A [Drosophila serrata]|uniref:zinc finger protein 33A n=1 Tax=Drosophila serrata TaxID=7274 RepID=UPI000A1D30DE|nr:zinc finger protein 33A [Drosophila serrata]
MRDAVAQPEPEPEPSSSEANGSCHGQEEQRPTGSAGSEREAEANESQCTICGVVQTAALLDLRSNHEMHRRLSRDWKIHADVIRSTLRAICVDCVCKLNMHSEVTRSLMQRMQRLQRSGGGTATVTTTTQLLSPPIADAEVSTTQENTAAVPSARSSRSSCSVLEVYLAQPTETVGESGGEKHSAAAEGWKWRTRLECPECGRTYFRRDFYAQHMRRCCKRRTQPRPPRAKCRVRNEAGIDDDEDDNTPPRARRSLRTFLCRHCDAEFESLTSQRQHERAKHLQRFPCDLCEAQFDTKYEWELHHTICQAKREALGLLQQDEESGPAALPSRTRSQSRGCSVFWDKYNKDENGDDEEEETEEGDDDDMEDAMYTRRMNFTGDWIVNHSRSNSNSAMNLSLMMYDEYGLGETHMTTDKEYDLYLLDLLITQVRLNAFTCFVPACGYQTDSLVTLMKHDYLEHWKMSWFYCHKCGDVFTSKVFLDYHMHRQNRGLYICHKCRDEFEYQHQLDRHFLLHNKGINYHCNFCRLEFLSEAKLLAHCKRCGHSPNDEPKIRIDRSLTITNCPVEETPLTEKDLRLARAYKEKELYIPKVEMPSLRPKPLPDHKPFRFAIGICEFDERNPPNCVGCH